MAGYFTGARAYFFLNGNLIAIARGVSGSEEITQEPINVLGHLETVDYAPTSYRVTFRVRLFKPIKDHQLHGKLYPDNTGEGRFPQAIFDWRDVEAAITDKDGNIIMRITQVRPTTRTFDVESRTVWGEDISFVGIRLVEK